LEQRQKDQPRFWATTLRSRRAAGDLAYEAYSSGFAHTLNLEEALSKTVGETLERYFMSQPNASELTFASYAHLRDSGNAALDITALPGFLPWQKERHPKLGCDEHSMLSWVRGTRYADGQSVLLPAQSVFWTYRTQPDENILVKSTTSGCAGYFDRTNAIHAALLEAIQRDGFLVYWLNSLSPHIVDTSHLSDERTRDFIAKVRASGLECLFLDVTTDIRVPTCVCVLRGRVNGEVCVSIGAAAGFTEASTLLASVLEAVTVYNFSARNTRYVLPENYTPFTSGEIGRDERIFAWKSDEMMARFDFFTSGKKRQLSEFLRPGLPSSSAEQLHFILHALESLGPGYEPYIYDAQDPLLSQLGFFVVRAVVPALAPLYLREYAATLDCKRLREVPRKLGYEPAQHYNPWPHPFP
jgi:ribosomal protein S12 methylthiotransferase accessory factor